MKQYLVNKNQVIELLIESISSEININKNQINITEELANYGIDSVSSEMIVVELEEAYGVEIPTTILWDYPNIEEISEAIVKYIKNYRAEVPGYF